MRAGCLVPIISGHRSLLAGHDVRKLHFLQGVHSPEHTLFLPSNCPRNGEHRKIYSASLIVSILSVVRLPAFNH